jgi:hypothetical protein
LKIVLTHIGNPLPNYVQYSLQHLRKFNGCVPVDFIIDKQHFTDDVKSLFNKQNITPIFSNEFSKDEEILALNELTWIKEKHPLGPPTTYKSQDNFWHLTMERLFYLNAYINAEKLENILHIENDNVLFYNVNSLTYKKDKISCVYRHHSGEDSTLFSFAIIPHYRMMYDLCKAMIFLVAMGERTLQTIYGFDHISEMHLLTVYRNAGNLHILPIIPGDGNFELNPFVFDPFGYAAFIFGTNNFQPPGFFDNSDLIGRKLGNKELKIHFIKDGRPYIGTNDSDKTYPLFNLHMHRKNIEDLL